MPDASRAHEHVLAVHPTARGFGWALFDTPDSLLDWGLVHAVSRDSSRLIARLERILSRYEPSVLVVEEFDGDASRRAERIRALYRAFEKTAARRGVPVVAYARELVASVLEVPASASRYEIACTVASRLDDLSHRLPPKRQFGDGEDARQSLFAAAALAIARYAVLGRD